MKMRMVIPRGLRLPWLAREGVAIGWIGLMLLCASLFAPGCSSSPCMDVSCADDGPVYVADAGSLLLNIAKDDGRLVNAMILTHHPPRNEEDRRFDEYTYKILRSDVPMILSAYRRAHAVAVRWVDSAWRFGIINVDGRCTSGWRFDIIANFDGYTARAGGDGATGVIAVDGRWIAKDGAEHDRVWPAGEGRVFYSKGGLIGILDDHGRCVTPPSFLSASGFRNGQCLVGIMRDDEEEEILVDRTGQPVVSASSLPPGHSLVTEFQSGVAWVEADLDVDGVNDDTSGRAYTLIRKDGSKVFERYYGELLMFRDGISAVRVENAAGYVHSDGKMRRTSGGTAGLVGLIDQNGVSVREPRYSRLAAHTYEKGMAVLSFPEGTGYGILGNGWREIVPPVARYDFDSPISPRHGCAVWTADLRTYHVVHRCGRRLYTYDGKTMAAMIRETATADLRMPLLPDVQGMR